MNARRASALGFPTNKGMRQLIRAAIDPQYNPLIREQQANIRASDYRANKELPAWYESYRSQIAQMGSDNARNAAESQGRLANLSEASENREAGIRSEIANQLAADAQSRNANYNPADADSLAAGAAAARGGATAAILAQMQGQQMARGDYLQNRALNTREQQTASVASEGLRKRKTQQDLNKTRQERRLAVIDFIDKMRQGNNQFYLDRASLAETRRSNNLDYAASMANNSGGGSGGSGSNNDPPGDDRVRVAVGRLEQGKWAYPKVASGRVEANRRAMFNWLTGPKGGSFSTQAANQAIDRWYKNYKRWEKNHPGKVGR